MEFVIVTYWTKRSVHVDGELMGYTNEVLYIDAGTHRFNLGAPADYYPTFQQIIVTRTTVLSPMKIIFV